MIQQQIESSSSSSILIFLSRSILFLTISLLRMKARVPNKQTIDL